ncbi:uncharacterized protein LOC110808405 [Carica papaya]|uniref:uncharacterized protein LOC110808405 n=1 Tax=Carica papaya TaxID=3649 RepID=UPI000B8C9BA7|nr:uncharacterized protein LOC110808405 [Carica papaya]
MVFQHTLDQYVIVFIDDILVYSTSPEERAVHLSQVLKTLHWNKLYAKFNKYSFWLDRVSFLGHVILGEGVYVDPSKVEIVINWNLPTNVVEVHSFLGFASYYWQFIDGFSKIDALLTSLTKKGEPFIWDYECDEIFTEFLKYHLTSVPVLILSKNIRRFQVYYDASHMGLGCVSIQHSWVVTYGSRQLKLHERNYLIRDLELAAIVFTLKKWCHHSKELNHQLELPENLRRQP